MVPRREAASSLSNVCYYPGRIEYTSSPSLADDPWSSTFSGRNVIQLGNGIGCMSKFKDDEFYLYFIVRSIVMGC